MWTLLGRAVLSVLIGVQRGNFVYKFFYYLTEWYLQLLARILPKFLIIPSLFLVQGVLTLLVLRFIVYLIFYNLGYLPDLTP
ncbi:hypothetical protein COTS27_01205 [Spirochaetota bacterium]|nr:hypothetical protein COTS27_01205 [Spirochaetota bacterium]